VCTWCDGETIDDAEEEENDTDSEQEDQDVDGDGTLDGTAPYWTEVSEECLSRSVLVGVMGAQ
jgi:hypothetical protein